MANKVALIKVILQRDSEAIKAILNLNAALVVFSFHVDKGVLIGPDGNTYSLQAIEEMVNKPGSLVFLPVESLTDEQIEKYQFLNQ